MDELHTEGGPNPALTRNLPGWLLRELGHPAAIYRRCGPKAGIRALRERARQLETETTA